MKNENYVLLALGGGAITGVILFWTWFSYTHAGINGVIAYIICCGIVYIFGKGVEKIIHDLRK